DETRLYWKLSAGLTRCGQNWRAFFSRHKLPFFVSGVDLPRTSNLLLGVGNHLLPLGQPACGARDGKQHSKHFRPETHGLIDDSRVKVYVGIELAGDEIFILKGDSLQFQGDVKFVISARDREYFPRRPLDDLGARIVVLIDAVAKAHQLAVPFFHALDVGGDIRFGADFVEHGEY